MGVALGGIGSSENTTMGGNPQTRVFWNCHVQRGYQVISQESEVTDCCYLELSLPWVTRT